MKMKRNNSSLQILQAAAAAAAAADGMAFDRPRSENDVDDLYPLETTTAKSESHDSNKDQNSNSYGTATCDVDKFECYEKMSMMERNDSSSSLTTTTATEGAEATKDNNEHNPTTCYGCSCNMLGTGMVRSGDLSESNSCNIMCEKYKFWRRLNEMYNCK